jgi:hypothetical protein
MLLFVQRRAMQLTIGRKISLQSSCFSSTENAGGEE